MHSELQQNYENFAAFLGVEEKVPRKKSFFTQQTIILFGHGVTIKRNILYIEWLHMLFTAHPSTKESKAYFDFLGKEEQKRLLRP